MKNRMETLETLYDYTLEDIVRAQIKIRIHDDKADEDVLEGFERRSPIPHVAVTKKEYVAEQEKEIVRLHMVRETIEKMIEEERKAG